jgi:hypothetical protein
MAGLVARYHEIIMAFVTKTPRTSPDTVELAERHAGPRDGYLRIGKIDLARLEDEDDPHYVGRIEEFTRLALAARDRLNAEIEAAAEQKTEVPK